MSFTNRSATGAALADAGCEGTRPPGSILDVSDPGTKPTTVLRVVLAEDNLLVREGVRGILEAEQDLEVVAACADADELRAAVLEHDPHVVVTDIHMPPDMSDDGIRVAADLRRDRPSIGVVVLSSRDDPQHALDLLADGAHSRAYLLKERVAEPDQLVSAVRAVASGGSVIDPRVVDSLIRATSRPHGDAASPVAQLSTREREVLAAMAGGSNNTAIAAALVLTVRAVERHINAIFAKLGLSEDVDSHRRVRAVLLYLADS